MEQSKRSISKIKSGIVYELVTWLIDRCGFALRKTQRTVMAAAMCNIYIRKPLALVLLTNSQVSGDPIRSRMAHKSS